MVTDKTKTKGRARTALGPWPARLINPISHLNAKELNYSDIRKLDASSPWSWCLVVRIARVIVGYYHHPVTVRVRAPCFPTLEAGGDEVVIRSAACYDLVKIEPSESQAEFQFRICLRLLFVGVTSKKDELGRRETPSL